MVQAMAPSQVRKPARFRKLMQRGNDADAGRQERDCSDSAEFGWNDPNMFQFSANPSQRRIDTPSVKTRLDASANHPHKENSTSESMPKRDGRLKTNGGRSVTQQQIDAFSHPRLTIA